MTMTVIRIVIIVIASALMLGLAVAGDKWKRRGPWDPREFD